MKKIVYIMLGSFMTMLSSCDDFLKESSQDLIRPITVAHYKELLQGEAYFKDFYQSGWVYDVMSDDATTDAPSAVSNATNAKAIMINPAYTWAQNVEREENGFKDKFFCYMYKNILSANICLEALDKMQGTQAEKDVLHGQAAFTRAYGYFVLANMYSQAYNESQPNDLCVPLTTETTPSMQKYARATVSQVWNLISGDIETAMAKLETDKIKRSAYEINYDAALILASRIYLYMENYDKVIEIGEKYLSRNPGLRNISTLSPNYYHSASGGYTDAAGSSVSSTTVGSSFPAFLNVAVNPEIKFMFGTLSKASAEGGYQFWQGGTDLTTDISIGVSRNLLNLYSTNDRRRNNWFTAIAAYGLYQPISFVCMKYIYSNNTAMYTQSMRTAEVYLNVAEAYARKVSPDKAKAISLLNELRRNRITAYANVSEADYATDKALVDDILVERRKELCFEEFHRWWDLRRTGQPSITHTWNTFNMTETWELKKKDPGYVLNFPKAEREFNPDLIENARPLRSKN